MAESSTRKIARKYGRDLISELPRNITENILHFLPIRDTVRSSILSKKWRHQWTTIPHLVFDNQFNCSMKNLLDHKDPELQAFIFVSVINKIILLHNAPILKFSLKIPAHHFGTVTDYLNQWIFLLSRNGIKELDIDCSGNLEIYELTSNVFSCLELTHLKLEKSYFHPPAAFGGFPYLTNLEFSFVIRDLGEFRCNCPLLENLTLKHCVGISHVNFFAPKLKCLLVRSQPIPRRTPQSLKVVSMTLTKSMQHLQQMKISNVVKVLDYLPRVEKFCVGGYFLQFLAAGVVPSKLPKPLHYLKNLEVSRVNFAEFSEIMCLLCLLRSAPSLCRLGISTVFNNNGDEAALTNFQLEDTADCTLSRLLIVKFNNFSGSRAELGLIKFVLAYSPMLETLFIHRDAAVKTDQALTLAEEIMQFPRASSKAQIKHLKNPVWMVSYIEEYVLQQLNHDL